MASHSKIIREDTVYGRRGGPVDYSGGDVTLPASVRYVCVTAAGNLVVHPVDNPDGVNITFTSAPVGFVPPYRVDKVIQTGSTASVATVY